MAEPTVWRLINSGALPGAMNMALDDALLQAVADGVSPPVLRLYRWVPATLTLGYAQQVGLGIDLDACRRAGVAVVRRPTGGRAVLHDREVTYAVIAPIGPPFGTSVAESYRVIAGVLREALCRCGLAAELVPGKPRGEQGQAVCFTAPAQHELLIAGCKVAGCAQKRRGSAFLQHGSIPLDLDLALLRRLLPETPEAGKGANFAAIGWLNRFAPRGLDIAAVEQALVESFAGELGVDLRPSEPTAGESELAAKLRTAYYADPLWTRFGPGYRETPSSANESAGASDDD